MAVLSLSPSILLDSDARNGHAQLHQPLLPIVDALDRLDVHLDIGRLCVGA